MTKIVAIYGSPRQGGNTDTLLDKVIEGVLSVTGSLEKFYARSLRISGCAACGSCNDTGICIIDDDMQRLYPYIEEADLLFIASPVYFYGVSAQLKLIIDRSQAIWAKYSLSTYKNKGKSNEKNERAGYLIAAGATKGDKLFFGMELTAKYFYDALGMKYGGGLLFRGLEGKRDISAKPDFMEEARIFGINIIKNRL